MSANIAVLLPSLALLSSDRSKEIIIPFYESIIDQFRLKVGITWIRSNSYAIFMFGIWGIWIDEVSCPKTGIFRNVMGSNQIKPTVDVNTGVESPFKEPKTNNCTLDCKQIWYNIFSDLSNNEKSAWSLTAYTISFFVYSWICYRIKIVKILHRCIK